MKIKKTTQQTNRKSVLFSSSSRTRRDQRQRFARDVMHRIRVRRFHDARPRRRRERDVDREKLRLTDAEKRHVYSSFGREWSSSSESFGKRARKTTRKAIGFSTTLLSFCVDENEGRKRRHKRREIKYSAAHHRLSCRVRRRQVVFFNSRGIVFYLFLLAIIA